MSDVLVLFGAVATSLTSDEMMIKDKAYVVSEDGYCRGVFDELPDEYADAPVADYGEQIIIPGLVDLCSNAINYNNRGILLDKSAEERSAVMLKPEEANYDDLLFAERAQDLFIEDMYEGVTTRAVLRGNDNPEATMILMELMEDSGLVSIVGNAVADLPSDDADAILEMTEDFVKASLEFGNTYPSIGTVSASACSDKLMNGLYDMADDYELLMQTQYDEKLIEALPELEVDEDELFINCVASVNGSTCPEDDDLEALLNRGVALAICPSASLNGDTPIPPVKHYLDAGITCGLGTDMGNGYSPSLFKAMVEVMQLSRLKAKADNDPDAALSFEEAFYMATVGGGSAIGLGGAFADGMEFDAVVLSDENLETLREMTTRERLERLVYLSDDRNIVGKFVRGNQIY